MKQWWKQILMGCMVFFLVLPVVPSRGQAAEVPEELNQLYAQSAVLMDADSGRILFEKNGQEVRAMASTTKIMTLIVTLENADLEGLVTISEYAAGMPDVQLNARKGEQYRLEDLLCSLMLESHNDSAAAIAEHVAWELRQEKLGRDQGTAAFEQENPETGRTEAGDQGTAAAEQENPEAGRAEAAKAGEQKRAGAESRSKEESRELIREFASLMNDKARDIGCYKTHFVTPNGLDGEDEKGPHSTTAEDLARILRYCITQSPKREEFLEITRRPSHAFRDVGGSRSFSVQNHNAFLQMMDGALTGKTGFTNQAGYCYVGALRRDGKTYIAALLACGWPNHKSYKWSDMRKLMNYGLENYTYHSFMEVEPDVDSFAPIPVTGGRGEEIGQAVYTRVKRAKAGKNNEENPAGGTEESGSQDREGILLKEEESIQVECQVEERLDAPVEEGTQVGLIRYLVDGQVYKTELLVAGDTVYGIDFSWCAWRVWELFLLPGP